MRNLRSHRLVALLGLAALIALVLVSAPPALAAAAPSPTTFRFYLPLVMHNYKSLLNGDFESGRVAWQENSTNQYAIIVDRAGLQTIPPHAGNWAAWLGGSMKDETASLTQTVSIDPAAAYLVYWQRILSRETNCGMDYSRVLVNGETLHQDQLCTATNTNGWVQQEIDLYAYAGRVISIQFMAYVNGTGNSSLYLDDISMQP
jgi:hypothetical protein